MIVDAHCHAWRTWPYAVRVPDPSTRGSVASLLFEMDAAGVNRAMLVAAGIGAGESRTDNTDNNDYVLEALQRHPDRLWACIDVDSRWSATYHAPGGAGRVRDHLTRALAASDRVVGVTHYLADSDDGWLDSQEGLEFLAAVDDGGGLLSLHARPEWFPSLDRALARVSDVVVLLHHQGHVDADDVGQMQALERLALHPNLMVKVSGFYYLSTQLYPYPDRRVLAGLLRWFGPERLVWGSDFPVSRPHQTYRQALSAIENQPGLTAQGLKAITGGTIVEALARKAR